MAYHLKTRIAIAVSLLMLGFMSLFSWMALSYFEEEFKTATFADLADSLAITADGISGRVEHAQQTLATIRATMPLGILENREQMQAFLEEQETGLLTFDNGIILFATDGQLIAVNPRQDDVIGMDFSDRDYIKSTLEFHRPYISTPFTARQRHHHPIIMLTEPIINQAGEIVAILGGSLDLHNNNFLNALIGRKVGKQGYYLMVDQQGTLVVHPDRASILRSAESLFPREQASEFVKTDHGKITQVTIAGQEMIGAFQHVAPLDWTLIALTPLAEEYRPINKARIYLVFALATLSVVMILAVRLLSSRL
ncbi:MAG: cache domain-containing protein, partial [Desulfuromonadales bacterium]|nr:cache domain-containing protein [Desulfuromonadales bacterium]